MQCANSIAKTWDTQSPCNSTIPHMWHTSAARSKSMQDPTSRKLARFRDCPIVPLDDTLDNSAAGIDFPESVAVTACRPRVSSVHPYVLWPLPAGHQRYRGRSVWDPLLQPRRLYSRSAHKRLLAAAARLRVNESACSNVRDRARRCVVLWGGPRIIESCRRFLSRLFPSPRWHVREKRNGRCRDLALSWDRVISTGTRENDAYLRLRTEKRDRVVTVPCSSSLRYVESKIAFPLAELLCVPRSPVTG